MTRHQKILAAVYEYPGKTAKELFTLGKFRGPILADLSLLVRTGRLERRRLAGLAEDESVYHYGPLDEVILAIVRGQK